MKRIVIITLILISTSFLYAQKDTTFYRHEVRASIGEAVMPSLIMLDDGICYANFNVAYFYRPVKWFWVGGNFINYLGPPIYYSVRMYDQNGHFQDFTESKLKYAVVIAPEIRFSFLNKKNVILYGALSGGIGLEDGYDKRWQKYPRLFFPYFHITYFGFSINFGENHNIFLGGEVGAGYKGIGTIHGGYRF
jgi:hypothetical protein